MMKFCFKFVTSALKPLIFSTSTIFLITACGGESTPADPSQEGPKETIADVVASDDRFNTLESALNAAGLVDTLGDTFATFTVFAPTDNAFAALDPATLDALLADQAALTDVLLYHVIADKEYDSNEVIERDGMSFPTASGKGVDIDVNMDEVTVDGVPISVTDIQTDNGIIHAIDAVLIPKPNVVEALQDDGRFGTLVDAVVAADLVDALSVETDRLTLFAPTDDAFAAVPAAGELLTAAKAEVDTMATEEEQAEQQAAIDEAKAQLGKILTYHVLPVEVDAETALTLDGATPETLAGKRVEISVPGGSAVQVNEIDVSEPDALITGNAIVHELSAGVLIPLDNVWQYLVAAGDDFSTLRTALDTAGLAEALADETANYTVFAPNNSAFEATFGSELALQGLLDESNRELLTNTLLFHVLPTEQSATAVANAAMAGGEFETLLDGAPLSVSDDGMNIILNDEVAVNAIDEPTSNGVIHLLEEGVLTAPTPTPEASSTPTPTPTPTPGV